MKIIVSQSGDTIITVSDGMYFNIGGAEIDGKKYFSVGVGDLSLGLFKEQEDAFKVLNSISEFLTDEKVVRYQVGAKK